MVSFILCLLPALLATSAQAVNVTCKMCPASADSCDNPTATCQIDTANGACFMLAEDNTLEGTQTKAFSRGCSEDKNNRKEVISFTVGKGKYLRLSTEICNTDNCNVAKLEVPTVAAAANEMQCPTCFALNSNPCNSQITPCTGNEDHCVDFAGTLKKGSAVSIFVAKGCGSASTKSITDGTSLVSASSTFTFTKATSNAAEKITTTKPPATTTTKTTTATTSGASPALGRFSFALYLPGLTGLLLVKLLS